MLMNKIGNLDWLNDFGSKTKTTPIKSTAQQESKSSDFNATSTSSSQENDSFKAALAKENDLKSQNTEQQDKKDITTRESDEVAPTKDIKKQKQAQEAVNKQQQAVANEVNEKVADEPKIDEPSPDLLTRRAAMQKFLNKMENELGVEPTELVTAFSAMSTEDLLKPAQESVQTLVKNLDLNAEQAQKAELYYQQMLKQTAANNMAEHFKDSGQDLSIELMSKAELRKQQMNDSVSQLSDRFFIDNKAMQKQVLAQVQEGNQNRDNQFFATTGIGEAKGSGTVQGQAELQNLSIENDLIELQNAKQELALQNKLENALKNLNQATQSLGQKPVAADAQQPGMNSIMNETLSLENFNIEDGAELDLQTNRDQLSNLKFTNKANQAQAVNAQQAFSQTDGGELTEGEADSMEFYQQGSQQPKAQAGQSSQSSQFVLNTNPQATDNQEASNVKEVINRANLLIKRGGGEMKVQMTPEGLGEVTMKVNVKNGHVNVEMITDSQDAKKILEKGMADLKATLASHKLNVDQIKVDVSNQLSAELNHEQNQQERQFAQQFMNDFKNENQAWRQEFFNIPGARAYKSQIEDEADNSLINQALENRRSKASRRLDLVA